MLSNGNNFNLNGLKFWNTKRSLTITESDPTHKVVYLGNVLTPWAKGDQSVDKPLETLWNNYCINVKNEIHMKLTICNSGLKAVTKEHGLTEYWANRVTYCCWHSSYPKVFCWIYRHDGRKAKPELRCHAVLCSKEETAQVVNHLLLFLIQLIYIYFIYLLIFSEWRNHLMISSRLLYKSLEEKKS